MPATSPVEVTEQRTTGLSAAQYRELDESSALRELIEAGVVSLVRSRSTPFGIRAGPFVGQALVNDRLRLVVKEKSAGALQSLLHWSVPEDLREAAAPSAVARSHGGPVLETFARRFLIHLAEYVRYGRLKEYHPVLHQTGAPRGRIDPANTVRLRARGQFGRVAYTRPVLTADVLPNRLLALALSSLDTYFRLEERFEDILERARYYAPLFEDVDHLHYERRDWSSRATGFREALEDSRVGGELQRALAYARAVVLHLGPWVEEDWEQGPPSSFFLNLQTLFEDAVRQVVSDSATEPVAKGGELNHTLFAEIADRYVVDPDIVVGAPSQVSLVADCKYKDLDGLPGHDDVYQIAAHAAALSCGTALLVYPGEKAEVRVLGTTAVGVEVRWATVRTGELRDDLKEVLTGCGVDLRTAPAAA